MRGVMARAILGLLVVIRTAQAIHPTKPSLITQALGNDMQKLDGAALLSTQSGMEQLPQKVERQGFLGRMKGACAAFVLGWILMVFSFPCLWFNESMNAKMEALMQRGLQQCRTVTGKAAEEENRNWLVHVEGAEMKSVGTVNDPDFDVSFDDNCVRLRRSVEVYQYIQHEQKEEKEKLGGTKETITTYSYTCEWSSFWHNSDYYEDRSKVNRKPEGLELGTTDTNCSRVECGGAFQLTEQLVDQCSAFTMAAGRLNNNVSTRKGLSFEKDDSGTFYYSMYGGGAGKPTVGDARVTFEYVPDGPISLLALQVETESNERDSFLPYRLIRRGWCGMNDDDEKKALRVRAELSDSDLAKESQIGTGCIWCLCCACNLVNLCFSHVLRPEIYHLFHGTHSIDQCFEKVSTGAQVRKWAVRIIGWLMLFIGLYLIFSPLLTFIKIIPFLGPLLSKLGGWLIWVLCLVVTLVVATVIICLAYLAYHPLQALMYSVLAAAIIAIPVAILHVAG